VVADTGVSLNSLYVHKPRKENFFKNMRGNETFCDYVTSKPSNTHHTYISFLITLEKCMPTGQETKKKKRRRRRKKEEEKKKKNMMMKKKMMMMMIGFLDSVNVHHKCAARGRSVI